MNNYVLSNQRCATTGYIFLLRVLKITATAIERAANLGPRKPHFTFSMEVLTQEDIPIHANALCHQRRAAFFHILLRRIVQDATFAHKRAFDLSSHHLYLPVGAEAIFEKNIALNSYAVRPHCLHRASREIQKRQLSGYQVNSISDSTTIQCERKA